MQKTACGLKKTTKRHNSQWDWTTCIDYGHHSRSNNECNREDPRFIQKERKCSLWYVVVFASHLPSWNMKSLQPSWFVIARWMKEFPSRSNSDHTCLWSWKCSQYDHIPWRIIMHHKILHRRDPKCMASHSVGFRLCVSFGVCILMRESFLPSSKIQDWPGSSWPLIRDLWGQAEATHDVLDEISAQCVSELFKRGMRFWFPLMGHRSYHLFVMKRGLLGNCSSFSEGFGSKGHAEGTW